MLGHDRDRGARRAGARAVQPGSFLLGVLRSPNRARLGHARSQLESLLGVLSIGPVPVFSPTDPAAFQAETTPRDQPLESGPAFHALGRRVGKTLQHLDGLGAFAARPGALVFIHRHTSGLPECPLVWQLLALFSVDMCPHCTP